MPRCWRSASRRPAHYGIADAGNPDGRRRAVLGAGRGARSGAGLEAAAGEGFQPQDLAGARPRPSDAQRRRRTSPNTRACWRRSTGSDPEGRARAGHRSALDRRHHRGRRPHRSARSPSASSSRPRSAPRPRCRGETRALIEQFLAIAGDPDEAAAELRALAGDAGLAHRRRRSTCSRAAPAFSPRAASTSAASASRPPSAAASTTTPASCSNCTIRRARRTAAGRRRPLRRAARRGSAAKPPIPAVGFAVWIERVASARRRRMSAPLVIAVPAKGRLQENAEAFFARAGLQLVKPRGARDYRGAIADLPASRSPICRPPRSPSALAQGAVHLGVTGEDLLREMIADMRQARGDDRRARLRLRQCGGRGAAGLDRRARHGRPRRRRDRVPAAPRPQDAGRHQIREPDARFLLARTASSTIASSRAPARPKARRRRARPS